MINEMLPTLSIRQPWAWLIVQGHKDIENRTWRTSVRGRLLIHAGKRVCPDGLARVRALGLSLPATLPRGIVGSVLLEEVTKTSLSPWTISGHWHWALSHAQTFTPPLPVPGKLGIFWTSTQQLQARGH